jgi:hypothetical protein
MTQVFVAMNHSHTNSCRVSDPQLRVSDPRRLQLNNMMGFVKMNFGVIDAPKSYVLREITLDVFDDEKCSFVNLLCPILCTSSELKRRLAPLLLRSEEGGQSETYTLYYCGQALLDNDLIPSEVFTADELHVVLFNPRRK